MKWRAKNREDFGLFSEEVIGFTNAPHQKEWCRTLGNQSFRRLVVAAPRNHSKSTVFSIDYPLWEIARDQNVRILLVSAADTQSQSFLREIKGRIERDQMYVDFTAEQLKPADAQKWTDKEIIINRSRTDLKDPTISTVSVEGTILSKRADIIICDDILNFENTRTPEQRQKIKDWFNLVLLPVLEPTGRLIVVGTIWQVGDLMEDLLADPMFDYRKRYKAIINEPDNSDIWHQWCDILTEDREGNVERAKDFRDQHRAEMDKGVQVMWPDRINYEFLYKMRFSDPYAFARAYMNDPASRPSQMIKREWIEMALAKGKNLKLQDEPHMQYIDLTTEGIDLAISDKTTGDDTCKVTLDKTQYAWEGNMAGDYIIRNIKRGKMTFGETKALITTDFYAIKPHGIRVETVGYQEALARELNDNHIPVRGHRTGNEKWDSAVGVNSIGILLEQGHLIIPSDPHDARTKDFVGKLVYEMISFPEGHTGDSLMALWFAYQEMIELAGTRYVMPRLTPETHTPVPAAPQGTPAHVTQETAADKALVAQQELMRSRAAYWQNEQRKVMNASAKHSFMRR